MTDDVTDGVTDDVTDNVTDNAPRDPAVSAGDRPDIHDRAAVEGLVAAFYAEVLDDRLIGPLFTEVARIDVAQHLTIMVDFWESALLTPGVYHGNALRAHRELHAKSPLRADHFERWLHLWTAVVHRRHEGPVAERAVTKAHAIARALLHNTAGRDESARRPGPVLLQIRRSPQEAATHGHQSQIEATRQ
ncbi:group III truncated hemoglobin [Streptomyces sp. NPDC052023]|uniref:group III truncated hemoglobin n=1 Tax=Streptomyces sp. NPDC052023 TaxID=3365681 RepID=UPI0037D4AE4B